MDMRRSSESKFSIEKNGIILSTSDKNKVVPDPNLKMVLREFPLEGDFVYRVTASVAPPLVLVSTDKPYVTYDDKQKKIKSSGAIIIPIDKAVRSENISFDKDKLRFMGDKNKKAQCFYEVDIKTTDLYHFNVIGIGNGARLDMIINGESLNSLFARFKTKDGKISACGIGFMEIKKGKFSFSWSPNSTKKLPAFASFALTPTWTTQL